MFRSIKQYLMFL